MEFKPPLEIRTDKELFDIISNEEKWSTEIQKLAYEHLLKRDFSEIEIDKKLESRKTVIRKYRERVEKQRLLNKTSSYSLWEMTWIVLTFPITILLRPFILQSYIDLADNNYRIKIIQRIILSIISILFWLFIMTRIFS